MAIKKKRIDNGSAKKQSQCCSFLNSDLDRARYRIKQFFNQDEKAAPDRQTREHSSPSNRNLASAKPSLLASEEVE